MADFQQLIMGDQSLQYLQEKLIPINCSVYSLPTGNLSAEPFNASGYDSIPPDLLPAYYVTNCSITRLIDLVAESGVNNSSMNSSPYNDRDNGDTFVALLFTLCASCVSCWMLTLLLCICPKHKQKPFLTQLATLFSAIVTTVVLTQFTEGSSKEYYDGTLDIIRLHNIIYVNNVFRVTTIIGQLFNHLAWLQIIIRVSKDKYKWHSAVFGSCLITAYFIVCVYYEVAHNKSSSIFGSNINSSEHGWRIVRIVIKLCIVVWFALSLLYFTTNIMNPRKVCYSKRLMPLAIFNWFVIGTLITINILALSRFKSNWLIKSWLELLPFLIEVIIITTVWEWIYNIWFVEKRLELMGVLGRRISMDDVLSIHSSREDDKNMSSRFPKGSGLFPNRSKRKLSKAALSSLFKKRDPEESKSDWTGSSKEVVGTSTNSTDTSNLRVHRSRTISFNASYPHENQHGDELAPFVLYEEPENTQNNRTNEINDETILMNSAENTSTNQNNPLSRVSSAGSYDDELVDNYEFWDGDDEGPSDSAPPPFEVHPGFNPGDYWPSSKH